MTLDPNIVDFKVAQLQRDAKQPGLVTPASNVPIAGGGGPPHDPGMDARVAALEAQAKRTDDSLHRMEVTLAGLAPVLAALPTKADMAASTGAMNTLAATVAGMDKRLGSAETAINETIKSAVGKAIGPWQLPVIIVGTGGALAVLAAGYHWLLAQPWFPH